MRRGDDTGINQGLLNIERQDYPAVAENHCSIPDNWYSGAAMSAAAILNDTISRINQRQKQKSSRKAALLQVYRLHGRASEPEHTTFLFTLFDR